MKKYNINELLEKKKELEEQIEDAMEEITPEELTYIEEKVTDYSGDKEKITPYVKRDKKSLTEFCQTIFGYIDELAKVKTAIQKYNADNILGDLQKREATRNKISILERIKLSVPVNEQHTRNVTRKGKEDETLEITEVTKKPMFDRKEVDKQKNEYSAQERKLNTQIQKQNLNATIEI